MTRDVLEQLAATAHTVWCTHMQSRGWRRGQRFDEAAKTHDAIGPFQDLGALDRRDALLAAERLAEDIVDEVDYPRGDDREFTAGDIHLGQPVALAPGGHHSSVDAEGMIGQIIGWDPEPPAAAGLLRLIRVRWGDGRVTEHPPELRELRRL